MSSSTDLNPISIIIWDFWSWIGYNFLHLIHTSTLSLISMTTVMTLVLNVIQRAIMSKPMTTGVKLALVFSFRFPLLVVSHLDKLLLLVIHVRI